MYVDVLHSPNNAEEPRKKLIDFSKSSQMSKITNLERLHLKAALKLSEEDFKGALSVFENIIALYPLDTYAMHMAYFIGKYVSMVCLHSTTATMIAFF